MLYTDLTEFISKLESSKELVRIKTPVSPYLEISEITNRVSKDTIDKNKALLFENVKGYQVPVLINTLGSMKRMHLALGVNSFKEIANRIEMFLDKTIPDSVMEKLSKASKLLQAVNFLPKIVQNAPCQDVVITNTREPMLDKIPIITAWPQDVAPFITMTTVITKDPKTGSRNVGMYRMQKLDNSTTCMHWHKHHDGAQNFIKASEQDEQEETIVSKCLNKEQIVDTLGNETIKSQTVTLNAPSSRKMEVAVVIGCDPATMYSGSAPLPPGVDEFIFSGFLRNKPVELVKCKTVGLEVPAHAEIVLEGYVDLDELTVEGPFGDHTGFYSQPGYYPKFHITCMTHKKNPVYVTTIVGKPPMEDCYMGKATEQIFLPLLKIFLPEVVDMNLPWEGVFHNCAIISIKKKYPAHAKKVISAIWGLGQMMFTKYVIVVDEDVNVQNPSEAAFHIFANTDPKRDVIFTEGPTDILDHAPNRMGIVGKMGLDATRKWKSEGYEREWPSEMKMDEKTVELVNNRWAEYGF